MTYACSISILKNGASTPIRKEWEVTADAEYELDVNIPDAAVDTEVNLVVPVTAKLLLLFSDQVLTIKTNSSGSPVETVTQSALWPLFWGNDMAGAAFPLGAPTAVTKIFVSNASGATARLQGLFLTDATP